MECVRKIFAFVGCLFATTGPWFIGLWVGSHDLKPPSPWVFSAVMGTVILFMFGFVLACTIVSENDDSEDEENPPKDKPL